MNMKIELRYNGITLSTASAAFIRGNEATAWLSEIDRWGLSLDTLECYILPQSIRDNSPAGLFVIFKEPAKAAGLDLQSPYTCIGSRLYIPVDATLWPPTSTDELKSLLAWELQVFHPVSGLVGFGTNDCVHPADLFLYEAPVDADWSFAHPGLAARPGLQAIHVKQPGAEELMEAIKEEIGQKSLDELPLSPGKERSSLEKISDLLKYAILKGIIGSMEGISKLLPEGNGAPGNEGLLQKLFNRVLQSMDALQKRRNDEIRRLLDLFEKDSSEALQYAIPLNSPYLNRGTEQASNTLGRRSAEFNLRKLGGGSATDQWDVGNFYGDLRARYLRAAQKETDQRDFKKAAYIYAHLLGDYPSAANVLQQGGMYREAAAIYKDHLKNNLMAAECLEKGRLYHEAIDLYKNLHHDEKIGDLYTLLQEPENAQAYFETHIDKKLLHKDYLDAARVLQEKLHQDDRARQVLLDGWKSVYQPEPCLKKYFELLPATGDDTTEKAVRDIYTAHTPPHKRLDFLNVLEHVNKKKPDARLTDTSLGIAYDIIHQETDSGNTSALHNLKRFLPADKLVGQDAGRYIANKPVKKLSDNAKLFHLDQSVTWITATWHRNQFLVLGLKDGYLQMARGNWRGHFEYYSWENAIKPRSALTFITSPYVSNMVFVHSTSDLPLTRKNLPKSKHFAESLTVYCPVFLHKGSRQLIICAENQVRRLENVDGIMTIRRDSMDGHLQRTSHCLFPNGESIPGTSIDKPLFIEQQGRFYTHTGKHFLVLKENGPSRIFNLDTGIRLFASALLYNSFYLIISTNKGCFLARPSDGELNIVNEPFAPELTPHLITVISDSQFVLAEKTKATLFELTGDHPRVINVYDTPTKIVGVLPTSSRDQFGLVEESGRVVLCDTLV